MRVGTSKLLKSFIDTIEDHPHACGDKYSFVTPPCIRLGSSPCVWGQGISRTREKTLSRIIPMRVGTSPLYKRASSSCQDHPHACGDKQLACVSAFWVQGSSPCVWGQVFFKLCLICYRGIIPMRVGTRKGSDGNAVTLEDHPHACGDKSRPFLTWRPFVGSSPCVWGQERQTSKILTVCRIIPMRVGTSASRG